MDPCIAAIMSTPPRRRKTALQKCDSDVSAAAVAAYKVARSRAGGNLAQLSPCLEKPSCSVATPTVEVPADGPVSVAAGATESSAPCSLEEGETELFVRLFGALESTLVLFAGRRTRGTLTCVRQTVELDTGRELSDHRLRKILSACGGMLEASWHGTGPSAVLQLRQRADDGDARPPTTGERVERRARFAEALSKGVSLAPFPERPGLPGVALPAPCSPTPTARRGAPSSPSAGLRRLSLAARFAEVGSAPEASPGVVGNCVDRMQGLRDRVQQREAADCAAASYRAEVADLDDQVDICENAFAAHAVVVQLFARGGNHIQDLFSTAQVDDMFKKGSTSAGRASEAEVISGLTAGRKGGQSRRTLDEDSARKALDCLTRFSADWFVRTGLMYSNRPGSNFKRTAGGSSQAATDALHAELARLHAERRSMLSSGAHAPAGRAESPPPRASPLKACATPARARAESPPPRRTAAVAGSPAAVMCTPQRSLRRVVSDVAGSPAASPAAVGSTRRLRLVASNPEGIDLLPVAATPQKRGRVDDLVPGVGASTAQFVAAGDDLPFATPSRRRKTGLDCFGPAASPLVAASPLAAAASPLPARSPAPKASPGLMAPPAMTPLRRLRRGASNPEGDCEVQLLQAVAATPQKRTRSKGPVQPSAGLCPAAGPVTRSAASFYTNAPEKAGLTPSGASARAASAGRSRTHDATPAGKQQQRSEAAAASPAMTPRRRLRGKRSSEEA